MIQQVQQFEQRKAQLQQRVVLIEQLRKGQTGPVHMLDQISRALPQMLWLTELKQTAAPTSSIDGRCTTLTGLSEFVVEPRSVRLLQAVDRDRRHQDRRHRDAAERDHQVHASRPPSSSRARRETGRRREGRRVAAGSPWRRRT